MGAESYVPYGGPQDNTIQSNGMVHSIIIICQEC